MPEIEWYWMKSWRETFSSSGADAGFHPVPAIIHHGQQGLLRTITDRERSVLTSFIRPMMCRSLSAKSLRKCFSFQLSGAVTYRKGIFIGKLNRKTLTQSKSIWWYVYTRSLYTVDESRLKFRLGLVFVTALVHKLKFCVLKWNKSLKNETELSGLSEDLFNCFYFWG